MLFSQHHRKIERFTAVLLTLCFVAGCSPAQPAGPTVTPEPSKTPLHAPETFVTRVPKTDDTAKLFLDAWIGEDYPGMYRLLSSSSQGAISLDEFAKLYGTVANEVALSAIEYEILSTVVDGTEARVDFEILLTSAIVGEIRRENSLNLVVEGGNWKVSWDDTVILPDLAGGNYLGMDTSAPVRATIYDRNGNPLAAQVTAAAVGVYPDYVDLGSDENLVSLLAGLSGYRYDQISEWIRQAPLGAYLPLVEVPVTEEYQRRLEQIKTWGSAVVSEYARRLYYGGGIGTHVIGYVSAIQQEESAQYRRMGYRPDERVGRKGLELWGESILLGERGGTLYLFGPDGRAIGDLGSAVAVPGQDIYTTIDRDFQREVQRAMSVFNGAIVVLERDTGRVLAMASSPTFDPNAYEIDNINWQTQISDIVSNPAIPQFNRATQGQYPLGSVFKVVTLAAALESGRFTAESEYDCQYHFTELAGLTLNDWTWEHFLEDEETLPSGLLTLPQGLIRSCNPWFWHIGLDLYRAGLTTGISDMSTAFGLGAKTGIEGVDEEAGNIPVPAGEVDATNLAIGQGDMQVTPLQVARFMAAIGNGGSLYRPQLVEKIASPGGEASWLFEPDVQGELPIKPETLELIQEAMKDVVASKDPPGTAYRPMSGLKIPVAGKTGTAQAPAGDSHAWFAGYTFANYPNVPDIAVAVIAENAGEGSEIAAPIFRRVIELWFYGQPMKLYPWESSYDITREPTSVFTEESPAPTNKPGSRINP